jgi:hypothetical protein
MGFELLNLKYNGERNLSKRGKNVTVKSGDNTVLTATFNAVPFDFDFGLYIMGRNIVDTYMIVEQILPFFTPDFNITIEDLVPMGINKDIPIIHNDIKVTEIYEGPFDKSRKTMAELSFTMYGYLYQPIQDYKVIRKDTINEGVSMSDIGLTTTIEPDPIDADLNEEFGFKITS